MVTDYFQYEAAIARDHLVAVGVDVEAVAVGDVGRTRRPDDGVPARLGDPAHRRGLGPAVLRGRRRFVFGGHHQRLPGRNVFVHRIAEVLLVKFSIPVRQIGSVAVRPPVSVSQFRVRTVGPESLAVFHANGIPQPAFMYMWIDAGTSYIPYRFLYRARLGTDDKREKEESKQKESNLNFHAG